MRASQPDVRTLLAVLAACLVSTGVMAAIPPMGGGMQEPSLAIFFGQIVALIVCGRLVGELMERIGQPAVMGQLIGGILLGPSGLGDLWPQLSHSLFKASPDQTARV